MEGGVALRRQKLSQRALSVGNPAVIGHALRPVALRPCLSTGVPFSNEFKSSHSVNCTVNFPRVLFADDVKSVSNLRNCDHKNQHFSNDFRLRERLPA